jgi:hypothetical protein
VDQEVPLDTDAVRGDPADHEGLIQPAALPSQDDAFKVLKTLAVALDDSNGDSHRITRPEIGQTGLELLRLDVANDVDHTTLLPYQPMHNKGSGSARLAEPRQL